MARGFRALTLTGPSGVRAADTEFYNRGVRGRGINRKPHDLVVVLDSGVALLQVDQERRGRIDRHGLFYSSRVLGVTTWSAREHLERSQMIHLCKAADCQGGAGNLSGSRLRGIGRSRSLWPSVCLEAGWFDAAWPPLHRRLFTSVCCCGKRRRTPRRATTLQPRQIQEQGY